MNIQQKFVKSSALNTTFTLEKKIINPSRLEIFNIFCIPLKNESIITYDNLLYTIQTHVTKPFTLYMTSYRSR